MKKIYQLLLCSVVLALFASCGIQMPTNMNLNENQTQVQLAGKNYKIVKQVSGTADASYIFGIGGMSSKSLAKNSYAEMVKAANLTGSQAIINVTTEESNLFALVYLKRSITTHGTVIEFIE